MTPDSDMTAVPLVEIPGSEGWRFAHEYGSDLGRFFPDQGADDFAYACTENEWGPCVGHRIAGLLMVQEGENDGPNWIWLVTLDDGTHWWADGGCDYTGWDCQSSLDWSPFAESTTEGN